jgi:hypothetical protein
MVKYCPQLGLLPKENDVRHARTNLADDKDHKEEGAHEKMVLSGRSIGVDTVDPNSGTDGR